MINIQSFNNSIAKICEANNVKTLFLFGSYANGLATDKSDLDLVVDINGNDPLTYADNYFNVKFELEKLFNIDVDLLEYKALNNPYFIAEFEKTKKLIYGH
jgi:hypothetical protein